MPLYTPEQRERAARNINLPPSKYFDEFGFIRDTQPSVSTMSAPTKTSDKPSPLETFIGSGIESFLPSLAGLGTGMATGAAVGSVWPGPGTIIGALGGAILGGGAVSYGQDKLGNYIMPDTMKRLREGQAENPYAAGIGAFAGTFPWFRPSLKPISFLSDTAKKKLTVQGFRADVPKVVEAAADVGLGAGVEAGMSVANDVAQDREVSLPRAALMGTLGAVVSQPTRWATKLTGATPFEPPLDSAEYMRSGLGVGEIPNATRLLSQPTDDSLSVAGEANRGQPISELKAKHGDKALTTAYVNKINDFLETYRNAHLSTIDLQKKSRGSYSPGTRQLYADPTYANFQTPLHEGMHMMIDDLVTSERMVDRKLVDSLFKTVEDSQEFNEWANTPFLKGGVTPLDHYKGQTYDGRSALVEEFIAERGGWNVAMEILKTADKKSWFDVVKHLKKKWTTGLDSEDYNWALAQRFLYDRAYPSDKPLTTLHKGRQQPLDDEDDWSESNYENYALKQQLARERAAKEKAATEAGQAESRSIQEIQRGKTKETSLESKGSIQDSPLYKQMAAKVKRREDGEELLRLRTQLTEGEGAKRLSKIPVFRARDVADLKMAASKVRHKSPAIEELMSTPIWEPNSEKLRTLVGNVLPDIMLDARGVKARTARAKKLVDTFYGEGVFDALEGASRVARGERLSPMEEEVTTAKNDLRYLTGETQYAVEFANSKLEDILDGLFGYRFKDSNGQPNENLIHFVRGAVPATVENALGHAHPDTLYAYHKAILNYRAALTKYFTTTEIDDILEGLSAPSTLARKFASSGRFTPYELLKMVERAGELYTRDYSSLINPFELNSWGLKFSEVPDNLKGLQPEQIWDITKGTKPFDRLLDEFTANVEDDTVSLTKYKELYLRASGTRVSNAINDMRESLHIKVSDDYSDGAGYLVWPNTANSWHFVSTLSTEQLNKPLIFGGPNNTQIKIPLKDAATTISIADWGRMGTETKFPSLNELRDMARKSYLDNLAVDDRTFPTHPKLKTVDGVKVLTNAANIKVAAARYHNCMASYVDYAARGDTFLFETASAVAEISPDGGLVQHLGVANSPPSTVDKEIMIRFAEANPDLYLSDTAWYTTKVDYQDTILGERARAKGKNPEQPLEDQQFTRLVREKLGDEEATAYRAAFKEARLRGYDAASIRNIDDIQRDLADRIAIATASESDPFFAMRQAVEGGKPTFSKEDNKTIEAKRWRPRNAPIEDDQFFTTELERELRKNPARPFGLQLRKDGTIKASQLATALKMKLPRAEQKVLSGVFDWLDEQGDSLVDPKYVIGIGKMTVGNSVHRTITTDKVIYAKEKGSIPQWYSDAQIQISSTEHELETLLGNDYGGVISLGFADNGSFKAEFIYDPHDPIEVKFPKPGHPYTGEDFNFWNMEMEDFEKLQAYVKKYAPGSRDPLRVATAIENNMRGYLGSQYALDKGLLDMDETGRAQNVRWPNILPRDVKYLPDYTELAVQHNQSGEHIYGSAAHNFDDNTMAHVRGYMHTDADTGEKTFVILEAQSDWDAMVRKENERLKRLLPELILDADYIESEIRRYDSIVDISPSSRDPDIILFKDEDGNIILQKRNNISSAKRDLESKKERLRKDLRTTNEEIKLAEEGVTKPFLENWQATALKTAIRHAVKEGADRIAITDAPTSMVTQGHIGYPLTKKFPSEKEGEGFKKMIVDLRKKQARSPFHDTNLTVYQDYDSKDWYVKADGYSKEANVALRDAGFRVEREMGHRVNYETKLPSLMKKLVGDSGEIRTYGDTDAIGESDMTLTKLGAEDFKLRAKSFKLSNEIKSKFLNEQTQMFSDRFQPLDPTLPEPTAKGWKIAPDAFLESRLKKVSKLGESGKYLADKMERYYAKRGFYEGDFANTAAMFFEGYKPPKGSEDNIVKFLHDVRHKGKSRVNITDEEAHIIMLWKEHLKEIGDKHKDIGMLIKEGPKAFREMVQDPNYSPDMVDPEVVYYMTHNRASADPRAAKLKDDFIEWALQKSEMNDKEALEYYNNYMDAVSGVRDLAGNNDRAYFGALRRAKSIGLPYSWVEKNPIRLFYRYGRRVAHDFAFFEELQNDPTARWVSGLIDQEGNRPSELPIDSIAENPEVQSAMQGIILGDSPYRGADQLTHARIASAARVVSNVIMGAGTGARDIFTLPGTMAPYLQNFGDLKSVLKGARRTFKMREKALRSGSTQLDYDAFQFGDLEYAAPDRIVRNLAKASKFFRKYQGRQLLENVSRQLTYAVGEEIAATKIAQAKAGDAKARQWVEKFSKSVDDLDAKDTVARMAKEFTDRVQGAYDPRNLPGIALEGEIAPFLNLARWSIEKYNVVKEDVFKPMMEGDLKPLLMYTLGSMLSAVAIEKLNELLSNKRGHDATIAEVWKSPDASLDDYVYKIIALGQLGAFAGIASDATKLATATVTGRTSYNNPLSFPLYTFVTDTLADNLSDATEAIKEGEDPVNTLLNMTHAIAKGSLQNYRYISSWYDHKETKRKEKFRDLAVWKQLNDEVDALKEVRSNRFLKQDERKFKQSDDLRESAGMVRDLIKKAFVRAKGDPFKFKRELAAIKANSYQTMPSPKTMPNSFAKYLLHLKATQGEEAASQRLQDWMMQTAKNKAKSRMVP